MIYGPDEEFEVGGSRVVRSSDDDDVTIVGTGITVHEALKAADALEQDGITARVIDAYSIKPIDADDAAGCAPRRRAGSSPSRTTSPKAASVTRSWPRSPKRTSTRAVLKLAVREMPRSGKPEELLSAYGIDAEHIAAAARQLVGSEVTAS